MSYIYCQQRIQSYICIFGAKECCAIGPLDPVVNGCVQYWADLVLPLRGALLSPCHHLGNCTPCTWNGIFRSEISLNNTLNGKTTKEAVSSLTLMWIDYISILFYNLWILVNDLKISREFISTFWKIFVF